MNSEKKDNSLICLWNLIAPYAKQLKIKIFIACFFLGLSGLIVIAIGKFLKFSIDNGLMIENTKHFIKVLIILSIAVILLAITSFIRTYYINYIGEKIIFQIRNKLFARALNFDIAFFENNQTASITTVLNNDLLLIQNMLSNSFALALRNVFIIIGAIFMMFYTNVNLSVYTFVILCFTVVPIVIFGKKVKRYTSSAQKSLANLSSFGDEVFNNIKTAMIFNHIEQDKKDFLTINQSFFNNVIKAIKNKGALSSFAICIVFFSLCIISYLGSQLIAQNIISKGEMLGFLFYAIIACSSIGSLSALITDFYKAAGASVKINEFFSIKLNDHLNLKTKISNNGLIAFHHVSFAYPSNNKIVIDDLSFSVNPFEKVAIVGPSGAGKSTIFSLLLKLYQSQKGEIYLEGDNIKNIDSKALRDHIGVVTQDPVIFSSTIYDNLTYANYAQENKIWEVLELVHLKEFVEKLPYGLHSLVGNRGVKLSGGQKQRLSLARVILKDPKIILLDEATNALDANSDFIVLQNLEKLLRNKTSITIAHRLSTVKNANKIIVLKNGRLEQIGTHQDLIAQEGLYKSFCNIELTNNYTNNVNIAI